MADAIEENLPRVKIPATRVSITKQYILQQALHALGISTCRMTTLDFGSDEIIGVLSIEIPLHGAKLQTRKETFYGEPNQSRDEAIESTYASALLSLQNADLIFVDDANLHELRSCQRRLLEATSWAEAFEMQCLSQKAEISAMAEHIRLLTYGEPPSPPTDDDMTEDIVMVNVASPPFEDNLANVIVVAEVASPAAVEHVINAMLPEDPTTPPHHTAVTENLPIVMVDLSCPDETDSATKSDENYLRCIAARRLLLLDDGASSST